MVNALYIITVLAVAIYAIASGFRQGITRQVSSVLGLAFGSVAARVFTQEYVSYFSWVNGFSQAHEFNEMSAELVCASVIYFLVYCLFYLFSFLLKRLFYVIEVGIFNRILGAFFSLMRDLLWLSIILNLLLCFSSASGLLKYEKANDGNLVAAVMAMTHAFLGCCGAEEFAHFNQLKEAKTISYNFNSPQSVIITEG